jgi:hypothetical protein
MVERVRDRKYRENSREMLGTKARAAGRRRWCGEKNPVNVDGEFGAGVVIRLNAGVKARRYFALVFGTT